MYTDIFQIQTPLSLKKKIVIYLYLLFNILIQIELIDQEVSLI